MSASRRSAICATSHVVQLAARDAVGQRLREPLVQPRVEAGRDRPQRRIARAAQPQLDPQHEVVVQRAVGGQALVDHRRQALRGRCAPRFQGGQAQVAGALVGVLERLLEQGVARGEVVVHEPGGDARLGGDARDAHVVDPLARDEPDRGVQEPFASLWSHLGADAINPNPRHAMTTEIATAASTLTPEQAELQARARAFVEEVLMPLEVEAERARGRLPAERIAEIRHAAIDRRLGGGLHAVEHGGQGWSHTEWFLVEEQLGRATNALSWHMPGAYNVLAHGSQAQIDRYLKPALRGELHDAYAVTEEHAGSDPSQIATTATRIDDGWRIDGEKWFVTYGDVAHVYIVMAKALVDGGELPTLFLVERGTPGIEVVDDPPFTHSYPHGHPTLRFTGVEVRDEAIIGGLGGGEDLQRGWFAEERLGIAARGVGAMWRLIEETTAWALQREQGGSRIMDYQGVSFPLADSAADAAAGRLLGLEVARLVDAGADPKLVHAKAAMAKLFVSEAANRCADRAVQIFGGRGYMRTNVAERLWRELRVDRIWEGTSEIQRLIVARALERRGVERVLH